ncbi:MAG: FIST C-terminal domain-containing protein [Candidatus Riflebacteria bacterium]|nr:FIST C-terminal domain-containing protein [Candidatus Riflebacteria bacterium]
MLQTGLAIASGEDVVSVANLVVDRAILQNPTPDVAFLLSSLKYDQGLLFDTIKKRLGAVPIFGTTSSLLISNRGADSNSVLLLLMTSKDIEFTISSGKCGTDPAEVARYLASKYLFEKKPVSSDLITCILTGTNKHHSGYKYLQGMSSIFPFIMPVSGGTSLGHFPSENPDDMFIGNQYCGNMLSQDSLALLFIRMLKKEDYAFGFGYETGWEPVTSEFECTRTNGNTVMELDGVPIIDFLKSYLGEDYQEHLLKQRFMLNQTIADGELSKNILRFPMVVDEEKQQIEFWQPDDLAGKKLQLIHCDREDMINGARDAAKKALLALDGKTPELVLVFSCCNRHRHLHSRTDAEIHAIGEVFGPTVPIVGLYCSSEISPMYSHYQEVTDARRPLAGSRQFGCSLAIVSLGSRCPAEKTSDFVSLLTSFNAEDRVEKHIDLSVENQLLTDKLNEYEKIFQNNESALKFIIREQFRASLVVKEKNKELSEAKACGDKLQDVIKQYTPHSVWWKASMSVLAGLYKIPDEEIFATFVFMDVKGFTSYAEAHAPDLVIAELNRIFQPATEMIYKYEGDVDKYIGDCILARFENPSQAMKAAIAIQNFMKQEIAAQSPFLLRIGMNHGRIIMGNVGAGMRRENAMIGDAVNTAQRLEANCTPGGIMVEKATFDMIDPLIVQGLPTKSKAVKLKGKEKDLEVVEIEIPVAG